MGQRSCNSANISIGYIGVAVKFYAAVGENKSPFRQLTPKLNTVNRCWKDSKTGEYVEEKALLKGFEYAKDEFVPSTKEELEKFEAATDKKIKINGYVDLGTFNPAFVSATYFLGPDKGFDEQYLILSLALQRTGHGAMGTWASKGRVHPVLIRANEDESEPGLILYVLHYASEVRAWENTCAKVQYDEECVDMLVQTIERKSEEFDSSGEAFTDGYAIKIAKAAQEKKASGTFTVAAEEAPPAITSMKEALRAQLAEPESPKKAAKVVKGTKKALIRKRAS